MASARKRHDSVQLPSSDYMIHSAAAGTPPLALAEGKFVNQSAGKDVRQVEAGNALVPLKVIRILDIAE